MFLSLKHSQVLFLGFKYKILYIKGFFRAKRLSDTGSLLKWERTIGRDRSPCQTRFLSRGSQGICEILSSSVPRICTMFCQPGVLFFPIIKMIPQFLIILKQNPVLKNKCTYRELYFLHTHFKRKRLLTISLIKQGIVTQNSLQRKF